jgi:predicted YcjX-like family ATPase
MPALLAGTSSEKWSEGKGFARPVFAPPSWDAGAEDGPPHIRLDRAIEFLIGDKLE